MIIAIDGPAGSGKSTTALRVAECFQFIYLDTGAMYRAVALAFIHAGQPATPEGAAEVLPNITVDVQHHGGEMRVFLEGEDVTPQLRAQAVTRRVSQISALSAVREKLVSEQRRIAHAVEARGGGVVLDGRDIGTVVFPMADLKIFLVADLDERARRRQADLKAQGEAVPLDAVRQELQARDRADRDRALSPLRRAEDAVEVDTTHLTIDEQVEWVITLVRERQRNDAR